MVKLFTILSMFFALFTLGTLPWVSPVLYTTFSILQPQYVWFWAFDGIPAFKILAALTLLSWLIQASQQNIDYKVYNLPINKALLLLTVMVNMSHWFASYSSGVSASIVLELFNTVILLYFTCIGLLNHETAIRFIAYGFILTAVYYGYDANNAYFSNDWSRFDRGRLGGPRRGAYNDNNKFAVMLVVGFPFLLLGFFYFKNLVSKAFALLGMVLVLHGVFLTGSRGGLLAVAAAVFVCTRVIDLTGFKKNIINLVILAGFAFVVVEQAGNTLSRSKAEVSYSSSQKEPINPRIKSWTVGVKLIKNHPILGVGLHQFRTASAIEFPGESPHVAHNTFITFSANSGLLAGILYLYTFWACFLMIRKINNIAPKASIYRYAANASFASLGGFFVGAIFLDMIIFEPYYFLMMLITGSFFNAVKANSKQIGATGNV